VENTEVRYALGPYASNTTSFKLHISVNDICDIVQYNAVSLSTPPSPPKTRVDETQVPTC